MPLSDFVPNTDEIPGDQLRPRRRWQRVMELPAQGILAPPQKRWRNALAAAASVAVVLGVLAGLLIWPLHGATPPVDSIDSTTPASDSGSSTPVESSARESGTTTSEPTTAHSADGSETPSDMDDPTAAATQPTASSQAS
ncbi:MAG: hypothetical protein FWE80_04965, partial [Oscillospiraceae bacterium]|nr:hypothetical protein [Oscillospiraceae bacterium]